MQRGALKREIVHGMTDLSSFKQNNRFKCSPRVACFPSTIFLFLPSSDLNRFSRPPRGGAGFGSLLSFISTFFNYLCESLLRVWSLYASVQPPFSSVFVPAHPLVFPTLSTPLVSSSI